MNVGSSGLAVGPAPDAAVRRVYASNAVFFAASSMLVPVYPFLVMSAGGQAIHHQIMSVMTYVAQLAAVTWAGRFIDKTRRTRALLIGACLVLGGAFALGALAHVLVALYVVRLLEGAATGAYTPAAGVAAVNSSRRGAGEIFGKLNGIRNLARVGAPAIGGVVAALTGQWMVLLASAGVAMIAMLLTGDEIAPRAAPAVTRAALTGQGARLATTRALTAVAQGILQPLFPFFAASRLGLGSLGVGLVYSVAGVSCFIVPAYVGRLADRVGLRGPILGLTLAAAIALLALGRAESLPVTVVAFCVGLAVLVTATSLSQAAMLGGAARAEQGSSLAKVEVAASLGRIAGPLVGAAIFPRFGWGGACDTAACVALVSGAVLWPSLSRSGSEAS